MEAEHSLRQKIADGSRDPDDYRNLTDLLFPSGRYDEGIALYKQALTLPLTNCKRAQLSMELGWLYYQTGQRLEASSLAQETLSLLSTEPRTAEVLYYLGASQALLAFCLSFRDAKARMETAHLALDLLEQAIVDNSDFKDKPHAYIDAARLHIMLGNVDKAIVHCETCLGKNITEMQRISCLIVYAQALQREERFAEAEHAITEAFRCGANYKSGLLQTLYIELGAMQRSTNRLAESKRSFEQALAAAKADPYFHNDGETLGEIYFHLGTACFELGEFGEAISAYKEVLHYDPKDNSSHWNALYWLGRSYEAKEDYREARNCYREVAASPHATKDDRALARKGLISVLAKLAYESGKYEEAAAAFEEVVSHYTEADADYWLAILWLGSCHEGLGAYAKARDFYQQLVASPHAFDEDKAKGRKNLARSLASLAYESAEYSEAAAKFEEVLGYCPETDADRWNILLWLGSCYQGLGSYEQEQQCYRKVLASRHAADADKALARKKLTASLGKGYYEQKQYAESIAAFEETLTVCAKDDPYRCHVLLWLGYSCHAMETYARARQCFEEVLASPLASDDEKASARKGIELLPTF